MRPNEEPAEGTAGDLPAEAVARRAYEIYLQRGGGQDRELEDWLQAEAELTRGVAGRVTGQ